MEGEHRVDLEPALIRHLNMEGKTATEGQKKISPATSNLVPVSYNLAQANAFYRALKVMKNLVNEATVKFVKTK